MIADEKDRKIIKKTVTEAYMENMFKNRKIVIFGCTLYARDIKEALENVGIRLDVFIDNNKEKNGKKCLGVKVLLPSEFIEHNTCNFVVLIASKYRHEMCRQLEELGVNMSHILIIPVKESMRTGVDSEEKMESERLDVITGLNVYRKILNKYLQAEMVYICPYPGTGDVYLAGGFFKEHLEKNHVQNYVFIVVGESCVKVAKLFNIENIESITNEEKDSLLHAWQFFGSDNIKVKPLLYWGWRTKRYLYADDYQNITFMEMFQYDVFGADKGIKFQHPPINRNSNFAEKLFCECDLEKGKTVIIAPYASSFVSEVKGEEWEEIVQQLIDRGYSVCTNCYGSNEKPINGTKRIQFPYEEVVNVLEYAGTFIGIRSGLCDIASPAKCKMIIIYETAFSASSLKYFGLKNMGLNYEAEEIAYEDNENLVNKVMEVIRG